MSIKVCVYYENLMDTVERVAPLEFTFDTASMKIKSL
jgi:hypothetical protein